MRTRLVILVLLTGFVLILSACSSTDDTASQASPTALVDVTTTPPTASPTSTATTMATITPTQPPPTATPSPTPSPTASATPEPTATPTSTIPPLSIDDLTLHDIDGSPLEFLSADDHPHFGGFTLIHGTIAITGEGEVNAVTLEVTDASTGATFDVAPVVSAEEQLLQPLGVDGRVAIPESQLLFEISASSFAPFDRSGGRYVSLRLKVGTADGREAVRGADYRSIKKLVRYTADNRYYVGEEEQGGNSWVTPDVKGLVEQFQDVQFGDFSNMNGGYFPPHISHQRGVDVDAWFPGYNELDGLAAEFLLNLLNKSGIIERVQLVFISYSQTDEDPFWAAIRDVTLVDGRPAADVFLPEPGHDTHFHLRFWE